MATKNFQAKNFVGGIIIALLLVSMTWLSRNSKPLSTSSGATERGGSQSTPTLVEKRQAPIHQKLRGVQRKAKSIEWFLKQRSYPTGFIPPDADFKALEYVRKTMIPELQQRQLAKGSAMAMSAQNLSWTFRGPGNVGGRLRGLVVDPNNINVIYVGSVSGGVWKSTDGGQSWIPTMDEEVNMNVTALVMKPGDSNTLYAGTGEAFLTADALPGRGVFKTTNGGQTWTRFHVANGLNTSFVTELAISPANPSVIYACGRRSYSNANIPAETTPDVGVNAVFKSTNEGLSWTDISTNKVEHDPRFTFDNIPTDLAVNPLNPDTLYAAFGFQRSNGIWKTVNGGVTWTKLTGGLPTPVPSSVGYNRIELAMAPSNPRVLYASFSDSATSESLGIWKTVNGGSSWTKVTTPLSTASRNINDGRTTVLGDQGFYNNALRVHPTDPNTVFAGGIDIYRSTDGGSTWTQVSMWIAGTPGFSYAHADQHVFAFHAGTNPATIFAGNDGGIFKSTNNGTSWVNLNNGLGVTQFYFFAAHPSNPNVLLGGTQDNGSPLLTNGLTNGWLRDITTGDGGPAHFDEETPSTVYASIYNVNMYRYTNFNYSTGAADPVKLIGYTNGANGITQADKDSAAFFAPFEMSPNNSDILVLGTHRILKTTNRGDQWTPISTSLSPHASVSAVAIKPGSDNTVWAATEASRNPITGVSIPSRIFKTENNGATPWTEVTRSNLPDRFISDIEFQPGSGAAVYLTYSGYGTPHVFKSTDAGATWTNLTNNLPDVPVNTIEVHPVNSNILFAGADIGVFLSEDGGATWQPANNGFPATQVVAIKLNTSTDRVIAATHGRGAWDAALSTVGVSEPPFANLPASPVLYQNYPNPFNPSTTIAYELFRPSTVTVKVYDALGREASTPLNSVRQSAGRQAVEFNATGLASGAYFARLIVDGAVIENKKMMLLR